MFDILHFLNLGKILHISCLYICKPEHFLIIWGDVLVRACSWIWDKRRVIEISMLAKGHAELKSACWKKDTLNWNQHIGQKDEISMLAKGRNQDVGQKDTLLPKVLILSLPGHKRDATGRQFWSEQPWYTICVRTMDWD